MLPAASCAAATEDWFWIGPIYGTSNPTFSVQLKQAQVCLPGESGSMGQMQELQIWTLMQTKQPGPRALEKIALDPLPMEPWSSLFVMWKQTTTTTGFHESSCPIFQWRVQLSHQ